MMSKYILYYWKQLIDMLPVKLRKPRLMSLIYALLAGLIWLHEQFLAFVDYAIGEATKTGQVIVLEKLLNDAFDFSLRRIYIGDESTHDSTALFLISEAQPDPAVYLVSEIPPGTGLALYTTAEGGGLYNFVVYIPTGLVLDLILLQGILNKYKFAGMKYRIEFY